MLLFVCVDPSLRRGLSEPNCVALQAHRLEGLSKDQTQVKGKRKITTCTYVHTFDSHLTRASLDLISLRFCVHRHDKADSAQSTLHPIHASCCRAFIRQLAVFQAHKQGSCPRRKRGQLITGSGILTSSLLHQQTRRRHCNAKILSLVPRSLAPVHQPHRGTSKLKLPASLGVRQHARSMVASQTSQA